MNLLGKKTFMHLRVSGTDLLKFFKNVDFPDPMFPSTITVNGRFRSCLDGDMATGAKAEID